MKLFAWLSFTFLSVIIGITAMAATKVYGQGNNCANREQLVERLRSMYGEELSSGGLLNEGNLIEVWFNHKTGTWTILKTQTNGVACIVLSGDNWYRHGLSPAQMVIPGVKM